MKEQFLNLTGLTELVGYLKTSIANHKEILPYASNKLFPSVGDIYTISVNLAGLPGISVPCGMDSKGLPIGMQIIGDCFKENNIIRAAYAFEQSRDYNRCDIAKERD